MFSFERRSKTNEVRDLLQRVCNLTTPNMVLTDDCARSDLRCNRTIPVLLVAANDNGAVEPISAVTKDIGDRGFSAILTRPLPIASVIGGFWVPHEAACSEGTSVFMVGEIRQCFPIGGGFWQVGVEGTELLENRKTIAQLRDYAEHLAPPPIQTPEDTAATV